MSNVGTIAIGLKCPIVHEGDDIQKIVIDTVTNNPYGIHNNDIIGITESIVARANGQYCTVDDIAKSVKELFPSTDTLYLYEPIASRNRFSLILKGIARSMEHIKVIWTKDTDEVGNVVKTKHSITGVVYKDYYKELCEQENCTFELLEYIPGTVNILDCRCHSDNQKFKYSLLDVCKDKSGWGVLGSNAAGEEKLKLFPDTGFFLTTSIHNYLWDIYGVNVHVAIYGDGCFKDPISGIWEFADPVTCPGYTSYLANNPQETKLKYLADTKSDQEVLDAIKNNREMALGTTPRVYKDLIASLCDLVSGSGDKGTPIVLIKNYFNKFTD